MGDNLRDFVARLGNCRFQGFVSNGLRNLNSGLFVLQTYLDMGRTRDTLQGMGDMLDAVLAHHSFDHQFFFHSGSSIRLLYCCLLDGNLLYGR